MGLDNGICIKRKSASKDALLQFDEEWRSRNNFDLEVAYWRKCWNVRDIILCALNVWEDNDSQTAMTAEDVENVIKLLKELNEKNYTKRGDCIWDWKEFRHIQRRNLRALRRLVKLMEKDDLLEVYFYDSW